MVAENNGLHPYNVSVSPTCLNWMKYASPPSAVGLVVLKSCHSTPSPPQVVKGNGAGAFWPAQTVDGTEFWVLHSWVEVSTLMLSW